MLITNSAKLDAMKMTPSDPIPGDGRARAAEIRSLVENETIDRFLVVGGRDPRAAAARIASLLAYVGATNDEAIAVAIDTAAQLGGSEAEVEHVIGGVRITVSAEEPESETIDTTHLSFDGACVAAMWTERATVIDIDADWDAMRHYATREPHDPTAPKTQPVG